MANDYLLECMQVFYDELFSYDNPVIGSIYDIANVIYGAAFNPPSSMRTGTDIR
jgi:hypothetical protein